MMDFILLFVIFYFSAFLGILVHEMGHVLMYILFYKKNNWRVEIGRGGIKILTIGKFTIYSNMITGMTYFDYKKYDKIKMIMFFVGGPLASLIFTVLLVPYISKFVNIPFSENSNFTRFIIALFYTNLFLFITAIIPIKTKNYTSDGMNLLNIFKNKYL